MDTAYVIIMAGVTGAISLVLFTIHLIQAAPNGQDITRIALAMEHEAQSMTINQDTLEPVATLPSFPPLEHHLGDVTPDSPPPSTDETMGAGPASAPESAELSTETSVPSGDDDQAPRVTERPTLLAVLSGRDDWPARGLVDGVWRDLRTLAALANGVEGSATVEELDIAEHLGPTLEGLAGRLEVALDDLHAYPVPPPRPAGKDPSSS
jgi:hypothetical protein